MLVSSGNTLTDAPRNKFYQLCEDPLAQSSWHLKLTITWRLGHRHACLRPTIQLIPVTFPSSSQLPSLLPFFSWECSLINYFYTNPCFVVHFWGNKPNRVYIWSPYLIPFVSLFVPYQYNIALKMIYSAIFVNSHVVVRNNSEIAHALFTINVLNIQFSPVLTSSKTIVQYHNQDVDIDTVKIRNHLFTTRISHVVFLPLHPVPFLSLPLFLGPCHPLTFSSFL